MSQALAGPTVHRGLLTWEVPAGWVALSSASVGGGLVRPRWVANLTVDEGFTRTDLEAYTVERLAAQAPHLDLGRPGVALLTAADVGQAEEAMEEVAATEGLEPVTAWATVGVTKPTWAAGGRIPATSLESPGTINIVVALPVPLTVSALVQAVGTVTEAKAQALVEAGVPGTGTASDAVVVLSPEGVDGDVAPVPFAGVRSTCGAALARTVHGAVAAGLAAHPWVDDGRVW